MCVPSFLVSVTGPLGRQVKPSPPFTGFLLTIAGASRPGFAGRIVGASRKSQWRTARAPLATLRAPIQGKQARAASKKVCEIRALGARRKALQSIAEAFCPTPDFPCPAIGSARLGFASSFALRAGSFAQRLGI